MFSHPRSPRIPHRPRRPGAWTRGGARGRVRLRGAGLALALVLLAGWGATARADLRENRYPDGALMTQWEVRYEAGEVFRDGEFRRYHPGGALALQAYYRHNEPVGVWTWFDAEGNVMRRVRHEQGRRVLLDNGEFLQPEHVFRDPAGRIKAEGIMKFDKPHGPWRFYFPDGSLQVKGAYVTGVADGLWITYQRNGQMIRRETYRLGILHGEFRRAFDNGLEAERGSYDEGLRSGLWRTWYANGQLETEGYFREDLREGEWRFYAQDGTLLRRTVYRVDTPINDLPLPKPAETLAPIIPDPHALPFAPRLYDENGRRIPLHVPK
ncbi:MAG: hypothetical protein HY342_04410 [Candidatus Lambdaproteobacteria bacterium]|nr:hypothetical protein [Candidatus Lambdaproteobacteria bacterium]